MTDNFHESSLSHYEMNAKIDPLSKKGLRKVELNEMKPNGWRLR